MKKKKELAYSRALVPVRSELYKKIIISFVVILCLIMPILFLFTNKSEGANTSSEDNLNIENLANFANEEILQNEITTADKDIYSDSDLDIENKRDVETIKSRIIDPSKPMVALTYDDGPSPKATPRILDTLEEYNAVATFFDLGKLVEQYPDIVKREALLNCEVGNHTYSHIDLNTLSKDELENEIKKSEVAFENALGYKTTLFRPAYGNANTLVKETLDYPLIAWDIDSLDWKSRDKDKILEEIRKIEDYNGKIILMHSIYESTADATEILVPELLNQGYQLVTVSELAYYKNIELEAGKVYKNF